jgi:hypothetical protein
MTELKDFVKIVGIVEVTLRDAQTGEVVYQERGYNTIVSQGKSYMRRNIIRHSTQFNGNFLCLSGSSNTPSDSETTVPSLITPSKTATKSIVTEGGVEYMRWEATWATSEANTTIYSVAIAENSDGTGEWARYVFSSPINKTSTQELTITYSILLQ